MTVKSGRKIGALLVSCLVLFAAGQAAAATARGVVEETVAAVIAVLNQKDRGVDDRISEIEQIVYERFDFKTMSKLVLARNWKKFSSAQQDEFVEAFKIYLSRSYGRRLDRYEQEKVEITGEREEKRGDVTVLTKIVGGQFDGSEVNYRMRETAGQWRVIDVVIEGVSLVSNYRSQFKTVVGNGGPEKLLAQLRKKNARPAGDGEGENEGPKL